MEGVFTLPYSEYDVINKFSRVLKKAEGYGCFIPVSRQQKGVDFIVINQNTKKVVTIQVKSSRSWYDGNYYLWFNNFVDKYQRGNSDFYVLYGLYPEVKKGHKVTAKNKAWNSIILVFNEEEMFELLKEVKTKKEQKVDKFFGLVFQNSKSVKTQRGFSVPKDVSSHLLENYLPKILEKLS